MASVEVILLEPLKRKNKILNIDWLIFMSMCLFFSYFFLGVSVIESEKTDSIYLKNEY